MIPHSIYSGTVLTLVRLGLVPALAFVLIAESVLGVPRGEGRDAGLLPTVASFSHTLTLDGIAGEVLAYPLSEAVLSAVERPDFADTCVFDAEGVPVPFRLRPAGGDVGGFSIERDIPYFIWQPENKSVVIPNMADIEINAQGDIVRVQGRDDSVPRPGPVAYLLDMQALHNEVAAPTAPNGEVYSAGNMVSRRIIAHCGGDEPFTATVIIKTSADLNTWKTVGAPQMLARVREGDIAVECNTLTIPYPADRYFLFQFADGDVPVTAFSARVSFRKTPPALKETVLRGILSEDKRTVSYTLSGRLPVKAIGFDLPQVDVRPVRLMGVDDPARPYAQVAEGLIYRIEKDGVILAGEPFAVGISRRYWQLRAAGGAAFDIAPGMHIYWEPLDLVFIASGKGPWTFAYGRAEAVQAPDVPLLGLGGVHPAREIAASFPLADEQAPLADEPAAEKNEAWIIWAALVAGAVILAAAFIWQARSSRT